MTSFLDQTTASSKYFVHVKKFFAASQQVRQILRFFRYTIKTSHRVSRVTAVSLSGEKWKEVDAMFLEMGRNVINTGTLLGEPLLLRGGRTQDIDSSSI